MDTRLAILVGVLGYQIGSISFARLVGRLAAPGQNLADYSIDLPGAKRFTFRAVSATSLTLRTKPLYGCLTSMLDILKVYLPARFLRDRYPSEVYHVVYSGAAVVGHNWPAIHRFRGGRGLSPTIGGMLVIDWPGALTTNLLGMIVAPLLARDKMYYSFIAGVPLLIPWFLARKRDRWHIGYGLVVNLAFWPAFLPELRQLRTLGRERGASFGVELLNSASMGRGMLAVLRRLGLAGNRGDS